MNNTIELDKNFFFGGNATFTIESEKTGEWKTYRIRQPKGELSNFSSKPFFVSLLVGPDNENSYAYIGIVDPFGNLRLTKNSKRNDQSPDVVTFRWFMKHLFGDKILKNATVHHEGKCGCCARKLTVPESIKNGIGPECMKKL